MCLHQQAAWCSRGHVGTEDMAAPQYVVQGGLIQVQYHCVDCIPISGISRDSLLVEFRQKGNHCACTLVGDVNQNAVSGNDEGFTFNSTLLI